MKENQATNYKDLWEQKIGGKYNLEGVGDNSLGQGFNYWMYQERKSIFKKNVKSLKIQLAGRKVLDIGPGTGFYVKIWKKFGVKDITGLDLTDFSVGYLKSTFPEHRFFQQDIGAELKILDGEQFDIISAMDVLFHIVDDTKFLKALKNASELLQDDGYFIFSDNFPAEERRHNVHTIRSNKQMMDFINSAGFRVIKKVPYTIFLNEPLNDNKTNKLVWELICKVLYRYKSKTYKNWAGYIIGFILFCIDKVTLKTMAPPSNQLVICQKSKSN